MALTRGEIWWADLAEPRGSEPGDRRPVLVVQEDLLNASALHTVMVVPFTTNLRRAAAVGNVLLSRHETNLRKECVALVCQVMTLDKTFFDERLGKLPARIMRSIDAGLRLALSLDTAR
jgi:mRNA interferase MazF